MKRKIKHWTLDKFTFRKLGFRFQNPKRLDFKYSFKKNNFAGLDAKTTFLDYNNVYNIVVISLFEPLIDLKQMLWIFEEE